MRSLEPNWYHHQLDPRSPSSLVWLIVGDSSSYSAETGAVETIQEAGLAERNMMLILLGFLFLHAVCDAALVDLLGLVDEYIGGAELTTKALIDSLN